MAAKHLTTADFDKLVGEAPLAMVDFWADWCGPCKMLTPTVEALAEQYGDRVLTGKVNVDVSDEELERRRAAWKAPEPRITTGWLSRYAKLVSGANKGAVME